MNRHDESGRIAGVCFFACFVIVVLAALTGCTNKIADFHLPEQKAKACPTLVMPPIGTECVLEIHGDTVLSNDCGDTLLRGYVQARSLLRPAANGTTK